tara:strand:+ start:310 stop:1542 length:1233 start_codon:yes stop_codon:yes gene_type:complete
MNKKQFFIILIQIVIIIILGYITIRNMKNNIKSIKKNVKKNKYNKISTRSKIEHGVLKNKLNYIINNTNCGDDITCMLFVNVGSRDEPENIQGISHVLEHMMFQGTHNHPTSHELHQQVDKYGASFNAFTSLDMTCYHITIHPEYIEHAMRILSDIYFNSLIREKDLEKEKKVVINEIQKNKANNSRVVQQKIISMIMADTPMKRPIAGTEKHVKHLKKDELMGFLEKYYDTDKVLLSIAGHSSMKIFKSLIDKYFNNKIKYESKDKLKLKKRQLFPNFYDKTNKTKYLEYIKKDIDTSFVTIGFPAYKLYTRDSVVLDLIGVILAGYMSSRLYEKLSIPIYFIYKISQNNKVSGYSLPLLLLFILFRYSTSQDKDIYKLTNNTISGHTLKHIIGGINIYIVIIILKKLF